MAPQPYFQERGTPIAVDLLVKALSEEGNKVDLLVFNEGEDRTHSGVTLHRVKSFPSITGIKPGFSLRKLYLDLWMFFAFVRLLFKNNYQVVHAVEESSFFAMLLKPFFKYKYVSDIDSSMTTQLVDKVAGLKILEPVLRKIESLPVRFADVVIPVCDALANEIYEYRDKNIFILKDITLTEEQAGDVADENLRALFDHPDLPMFLYIGNLESYQGIDLLIQSFSKMIEGGRLANLLLIGGEDADIEKYNREIKRLGLTKNIVLAGKRPVSGLGYYMSQCDVLASPRTQGVNTPMKVYSYLASGKPVIATRLPTHTQVMSDENSVLAEPNESDFSEKLGLLAENKERFLDKAKKAVELIEQEHSYKAFKRTLSLAYDSLSKA